MQKIEKGRERRLSAKKVNKMEIRQWTITNIIFAVGLLFWIVTYIAAPLESKKNGRYISGAPGMPFVCFFIAGLISPCKLLALLCFLDPSVTLLPFFLLRRYIKRKKQHNDEDKE